MDTNETKHTPGPWTINGHPESDYVEILGKYEGIAAQATHADAARIVACVNACEGISTEFLERHPLDGHPMVGYAAERDALRAENARIMADYENLKTEIQRLRSETP